MSLEKKLDNILLIDDSESDNYFHRRKIKNLGLTDNIKICLNAEEALEYLKNNSDEKYIEPNLIFVDINMPGMNGWEFLTEYAELEISKNGNVIVNMLSNSIDEKDKERIREFPFVHDYFSKPLGVEALDYILERHF